MRDAGRTREKLVFTSFSSVLPTSQVVYCASKPIERVIYYFYEITMEDVCQRQENVFYLRDQVAYSHENHEIDATNQSQRLTE